jgi:hypothetical protein
MHSSVADPGYLSRIPDPDFCPPRSRIPNLGSRISDLWSKNSNKREGWKNLLSYLFFSHKNHKIENYINFELVKTKIWANLQPKNWANLQRILKVPTQKIVIKLSKIWVWDPGSSGQKKHRIPDPDPQHFCILIFLFYCIWSATLSALRSTRSTSWTTSGSSPVWSDSRWWARLSTGPASVTCVPTAAKGLPKPRSWCDMWEFTRGRSPSAVRSATRLVTFSNFGLVKEFREPPTSWALFS